MRTSIPHHIAIFCLTAAVLLSPPATAVASGTCVNSSITEYTLIPGSDPGDITLGPDGAFWFTEYSGN